MFDQENKKRSFGATGCKCVLILEVHVCSVICNVIVEGGIVSCSNRSI